MGPELFYFDGTGRAQITRLIFTLGKHEFVDHRLSFPEHAKNKADPSHPVSQKYGSMPVLKDGDFLLAQSLAIATYAAEVALARLQRPHGQAARHRPGLPPLT